MGKDDEASNGRNKLLPRVASEAHETVKKSGDTLRVRREVEAMAYVHGHTSVPVPRVLESHFDTDDNDSWFRMERVGGSPLDQAWPEMSDGSRARTIHLLKSYFAQLHAVCPPEPGWIGSCSGGTAYDHRLNSLFAYGPFKNTADFHDFLVAPIRNCPNPQLAEKYRTQFPDTHKIVFAHADLSWEHIFVDPRTGDVTGIIDWEMAGFWPEWWEYRKALFGGRSRPGWWVGIVNQVLPQFPTETEADMDVEMF
ncbi:Protein kinase-like domain protein [Niveomyces insectorum RCEF 264]|uniref:Protein kinase-like domain protein n=1 Tax=Niveomyces insectorum RCEF 264 TaxID=1081102 RepID=A0A167QRA0_9HYPO|nr:Protein kinase-like domain protein [Niveomyces insectorum RCEF 264]